MKPDKKADDLLREKLNNYSSPVPAGLFDAMDKKREKQQAAGVFGWRVKAGISAMVVLLALGLVYWQVNVEEGVNAEVSTTNSKEQIAENLSDKQNQATTARIQTEIKEQQNSNIQTETTQEKTFIDNTQQLIKLNNSSASISTKVASTTTQQSNVIKQINSTENPTENTGTSLNIKETDDTSVTTPVLSADNPSAKTVTDEKVTEQEIAVRSSVLVSPLKSKGLLVDDQYHAAMPRIKCGWEARKVYLYFDAITSLDMAFRTLSPKLEDGESEAYAILRNKTEGMRESASLGFRASAVTRAGFAMRTGLIYSTIKEPFSQRIYTETERYITTTDTEGNILDIDTVLITEIQNFEFANRYKLLDVPVIFGYEIDKDKYNISFNGGAYINITASQEGRFLTPNNDIVDFSTNSPSRYDAFKTNVGMSLYGSFAVNYKITPALHFIFEPYGRYYMNSFTTEAHELNQNYFVAGMQVGLRMKM